MKYEIRVPTEANNEMFSGPVIFREDGKAIPFCNVHGKGQPCVDELVDSLPIFKGSDWWSDSEELRKETSDDSMFETFIAEVN